MGVENEAYAVLLRSPDAREALTAFLEKRKPDFTKSQGAGDGRIVFSRLQQMRKSDCEDVAASCRMRLRNARGRT